MHLGVRGKPLLLLGIGNRNCSIGFAIAAFSSGASTLPMKAAGVPRRR
jgi:hypothetical protein